MPTISEIIGLARGFAKDGNLEDAENYCLQVLRVAPRNADALLLMGTLHLRQQRLADAAGVFRKLIFENPEHVQAHNNLGVVLAQQQLQEEAIAQFDEALRLKPQFIEPGLNRGRALRELDRFDEAIAQLEQALSCSPKLAAAHLELGHIYARQGSLAKVVHHYEQAIHLQPESAEAHWNLAMAKLALGDFQEGWREYEWRWKCAEFAPYRSKFSQPAWDGSPLEGRTILLTTEQGLGDTLQFIRYAPIVKRLGGRVVVRCPHALEGILQSCEGIDAFVSDGSPLPDFQCHTSLLSLPFLLKTTLATIPAEIPYLRPDEALTSHWRDRLSAINGFKIGIVWKGGDRYALDRHRSIELEQFLTLAKLPGVQLISLQKNASLDQFATISDRFSVIDLGQDLDQTCGAFMDTAAVLLQLDLSIVCDTAIAHLAGALGVPTWIAVANASDWRWLKDRDDSPWYPSIRLYRQGPGGDWDSVFERMAQELQQLMRRT